jgi:hypothetical protein
MNQEKTYPGVGLLIVVFGSAALWAAIIYVGKFLIGMI